MTAGYVSNENPERGIFANLIPEQERQYVPFSFIFAERKIK